jgi:hypothetical protein
VYCERSEQYQLPSDSHPPLRRSSIGATRPERPRGGRGAGIMTAASGRAKCQPSPERRDPALTLTRALRPGGLGPVVDVGEKEEASPIPPPGRVRVARAGASSGGARADHLGRLALGSSSTFAFGSVDRIARDRVEWCGVAANRVDASPYVDGRYGNPSGAVLEGIPCEWAVTVSRPLRVLRVRTTLDRGG